MFVFQKGYRVSSGEDEFEGGQIGGRKISQEVIRVIQFKKIVQGYKLGERVVVVDCRIDILVRRFELQVQIGELMIF